MFKIIMLITKKRLYRQLNLLGYGDYIPKKSRILRKY